MELVFAEEYTLDADAFDVTDVFVCDDADVKGVVEENPEALAEDLVIAED